jgi:hypothetical protein
LHSPGEVRTQVAVTLLALVVSALPATAQPALDQKLPMSANGVPLSFYGPIPPLVGTLTRLTGVPIGIEFINPSPLVPGVKLSGLTLREALDAIARAGGYDWEEAGGVVVLRSRRAASVPFNPLDLHVGPMQLDDIVAQQALAVTCAHLGTDFMPLMPDRHRFSVAFPGGSLQEWLNAVVRAHGTLTWAFSWFADKSTLPVGLTFLSGNHPFMCPAPGLPSSTAVDPAAVAESRAVPDGTAIEFLDRPVPKNALADDIVVHGIYESSIGALARGINVSIGLQQLSGPAPYVVDGFTATGLPLRQVLDTLVTIDPRYEWRVVDDVVVLRPAEAWNDPTHPLFRRVDPETLVNVPFAEVVGRVLEIMGAKDPLSLFPDSRPVWLSTPSGTVLDLLCAMVRVHGNLMWVYGEMEQESQRSTGLRYQLMLHTSGVGFGVSLP